MRWFVLILLFIGMIINFADKSIVGLAATYIMKDLNLSYADWGIVGSSYYWLYPITGVIGAAWADRIGAKKMLGFLMLTWAVLQIGVVAITALPLLILYRILLGAFEGPFSPIAYSHALKWFPSKSSGFVTSVVGSGGTVGAFITAPLLIGAITAWGWKAAFILLGVASIVWFILIQFVKEKPAVENGEMKKKEKVEKLKLKDVKQILSSRVTLFTTLAFCSTYFIVVWLSIWLPLYLVEVIGMSSGQMGFGIMFIGLSSIVIYMLVSIISDRLFVKTKSWKISRIYVSGASMIIGALCMLSIIVFQNPIWAIIAMSLAKGLTYSILVIGPAIMTNEMPERGGLMVSILTSSGNVAGVIAPMVTGFIISLASTKIFGYNLSLIVMAIFVIISAGLFAMLVRPSFNNKENISNEEDLVEQIN
ncbi:MFS transporter [Bacillus sp. JJ722]|uniref:MFS transporter n=1 Tax=Bacillus sp. JJ722 TaxID=3122973 RepID=UPI002FFEB1C8